MFGVSSDGFWLVCFFCHAVLQECMVRSEVGRAGLCREEVESRVLSDKSSAPSLSHVCPILAPYVDNGNSISRDKKQSEDALDHLLVILERGGFLYRDVERGKKELASLGLVLDANLQKVRNKPDRA